MMFHRLSVAADLFHRSAFRLALVHRRSVPLFSLHASHLCSAAGATRPLSESPVLQALRNTAANWARKPILIDSHGSYTAGQLLTRAEHLAAHLPANNPVAVFLPPDSTFVTGLLAAWHVSAAAVPLSPLFPAAALEPLLRTVTPSVIVTSQALRHALPSTPIPVLTIDDHLGAGDDEGSASTVAGHVDQRREELTPNPNSLIFFTSGTTGAPKGVVWTNDMLSYQLETLRDAWRWSPNDRILNVLPLHHIHGLVNVVLSALFNGAALEMHSAFDAHSVWSTFTRTPRKEQPTIFMAVPSVYQRLIQYYDDAVVTSDRERAQMSDATSRMRLFVSGSAALSKADFDAWLRVSGHAILERYGMTETGMTLSNAYDDRRRGFLGRELPGVSARVDESGQLLVKSRGVFPGYWNDPARTAESFDAHGYFRTGDVVKRDETSGYYRLLGRANSDIVKSGGFKISTLEVEEVIRDAPGVRECTVLGVPDQLLGERIVVAIIPSDDLVLSASLHHEDQSPFIDSVQKHAMEQLPKYKVPRDFVIVEDLPRNVLGKVQKQILRTRLFS